MAALVLLLLGAGGCSVEIGGENPPKTSPKKERVLEADEGSWDLREPPTREEAGMPPGEPYVIYSRDGWWRALSIRAHVLLPEGKRIDTEASHVSFDSYNAADSTRTGTSDPTTMDISAGPMPLGAAHREMLRAAGEFGLSRSDIEEWYSEVKRAVSRGDTPGRVKTLFLRSRVGYLLIEVQGSFLPYEYEVNHAFVHYILVFSPPHRGNPDGQGLESTDPGTQTTPDKPPAQTNQVGKSSAIMQ